LREKSCELFGKAIDLLTSMWGWLFDFQESARNFQPERRVEHLSWRSQRCDPPDHLLRDNKWGENLAQLRALCAVQRGSQFFFRLI